MKLSCIVTTRNRREALLRTLDHLEGQVLLPEQDWEILVVDNGSTDGTPEALTRRRGVRVISLAENEGIPARNLGLAAARGKFVAFLDDATRPQGRAIPQAIAYLVRHPRTAAVVGRVILRDGSPDAPALPSVLMSGASVVRKAALDEVGGFAAEFFRQSADYELSFRIWRAGYRIQRFEDLQFARQEDPPAKPSELASRMGLRNNLSLCERYLPRPLRHEYRRDWMRRYALLARLQGHAGAVHTAIKESRIWARREAAVGRKVLGSEAIEAIFQVRFQREAVAHWTQEHNIRRVCIADWGKNLHATWSACRAQGLNIESILDNSPAFFRAAYRSIPVVADSAAARLPFDGIVISTLNPAQVRERAEELQSRFDVPVLSLWTAASITAPPPRSLPGPVSPGLRRIDKAA